MIVVRLARLVLGAGMSGFGSLESAGCETEFIFCGVLRCPGLQ